MCEVSGVDILPWGLVEFDVSNRLEIKKLFVVRRNKACRITYTHYIHIIYIYTLHIRALKTARHIIYTYTLYVRALKMADIHVMYVLEATTA